MHARLREPVLGQEILRPVLNSIGIVLVRLVELSLDMVRAGYVVAALGMNLLDLHIIIIFFLRFFVDLGVVKGLHREL